MYNLYERLNGKVIGCHCDALFIRYERERITKEVPMTNPLDNGLVCTSTELVPITEEFEALPKDDNEAMEKFKRIGTFKYETDHLLPNKTIRLNENALINESITMPQEIGLNNERDTKELDEIFDKGNTMIIGLYPGTGKSYAGIKYLKRKFRRSKIAVACPYNTLCGDHASKHMIKTYTLSRFFGIDPQGHKMTKVDPDKLKYLFDEIACYKRKTEHMLRHS